LSQLEELRLHFGNLVTAHAGTSPGSRVAEVFASTPRENFVGPGPWRLFTASGYIDTPSSDPAFLYQDVTIALKPESGINNGQPSLHALCLAALGVKAGETIVHMGAGTGYYTALLAKLTGPKGRVFAFEIDPELANRAGNNLRDLSQVIVAAQSGSAGSLPPCDVVYVNAGATAPLDVWLDALLPGGRLLFPLTPDKGAGGMLLVTRSGQNAFPARFLCQVMFIPCVGARDEETERKLAKAFRGGGFETVQSLRRGSDPDESCWVSGKGWWLSKEPEVKTL
jgi:protein-L-isoaspartate(D-aspartate) O-methyltransferase